MAERLAFDIGKIFNRGKRRLGMILGLDQRTKAQRGSSGAAITPFKKGDFRPGSFIGGVEPF